MGALPSFSEVEGTATDDRLRWFQTEVQGRRAVGAVGGRQGPPVLFLHGWALGSYTYKRALSRLVSRGCRVYAPALPSFGGTAGLPTSETTLDGYAGWVAEFMCTVGVDEPAMVIGHSFGGGVGIKLAAQHPDLVSYLVLLNAVGGVSPRPPWDWVSGFARELWPLTSTVELIGAVRSDLVPTLTGNPCGVLRTALLAQQADLREEARELRAEGLPVLVLTSQGDAVVPRAAFETLCNAIGTQGRVVKGGHTWMLADPDSFAASIAPVLDGLIANDRRSRAASTASDLSVLLATMQMPRRLASDLVRKAPPLWLLSDSPSVLAADLALCHPKLRPHEVRAVARPIVDSDAVRLAILTTDRKGLLADSAGVLAASGLSILHASAATWTRRNLALHSFIIDGGQSLTDERWNELGRRLQVMAATVPLPGARTSAPEHVTSHGGGGDRLLVTITVRDEPGALSNLCRKFSDHGINIESLHARSAGGRAIDTFLVSGIKDSAQVSNIFEAESWSAPRSPIVDRRVNQRNWDPNRRASSARLKVVVS